MTIATIIAIVVAIVVLVKAVDTTTSYEIGNYGK